MIKFDAEIGTYFDRKNTKQSAHEKSDCVRMHYNGIWYDEVYTKKGCELVGCKLLETCDHRKALKRKKLLCPCVNVEFARLEK